MRISNIRSSSRAAGRLFILLLLVTAAFCFAQHASPDESPAYELIQKKLYNDAIRVLQDEIAALPENQAGKHYLMLGECYYQLQKYDKAKPHLVKARTVLPAGRDKTVSEYRLACLAYRTGNEAGGLQMTQTFAASHPTDKRLGNLLLFKLKALTKRGMGAEKELLAVREQISRNTRRYGPAVDVAADNILTAYYLNNGQGEKAKDRYKNIIRSFMDVSRDYKRNNRPMPPAMERGHDNAAIQLAIIALKTKHYEESNRWLEIVRYDEELKQKSRLMLAQIAYDRRDYRLAESYLLDKDFIQTVRPGPLRSDMYLLLGFCAKRARHPKLEKVVEYVSEVEPGTSGYAQAQMGIGDTFQRWRDPDKAIRAYENASKSTKYEPKALHLLGKLYMQKAEEVPRATAKDKWYKLAAERFSSLVSKYSTSREAKESNEYIDILIKKGMSVQLAVSDEELIARWEKTVSGKPGSWEGARALMGIARIHFKVAIDEKTGEFIKAPDYAACVRACNRLLDGNVYTGKGLAPDLWTTMKAEAMYYRGVSQMASATRTPEDEKKPVRPTFLPTADLKKAIADLQQAQELVDETQIDLAKNIELGLLEAMLKSGVEQDREKARERFEELVGMYGSEPRFQKLAMDLAAWYRERGDFAAAAREYKGIADRGAGLSPDDTMKLLLNSGKLYSRGGYDALKKAEEKSYAIYVYPRRMFKTASLLETHKPFKKRIMLDWPANKKDVTAGEALVLVSKAAGIPFTWSDVGSTNSVTAYLENERVSFEVHSGTVEMFLRRILDTENYDLMFDIGLTGRSPTLKVEELDTEDPEKLEASRIVEVYDKRLRNIRYRPLRPGYGAWKSVHSRGTMFYHVVERIEELSGTKIVWADGVIKGDVLSAEFDKAAVHNPAVSMPIGETLAELLDRLDLAFKVVARDRSAELYEEAKGCFNEIRKISPRSSYGEKALFLLALNFFHQQDYERMKIVLTEYLKVFDNPNYDHYHDACFWVGWVFERERRFREGTRYYGRAAEERLVIHGLPEGEKMAGKEEMKALLSYDTAYALEEPVTGVLTNYTLSPGLLDYVRINAGVDLTLDDTAMGIDTPIYHSPFREAYIFDIVYDVLEELGLGFRAENVNQEVAERAYHRMAVCYKRDGMLQQALASTRVLLNRYPETERRKDALRLQLEIYKALKDYRNVLAMLDLFSTELAGEIPAHQIEFERAWIYFDLCRYGEAVEHFKKSLGAAKASGERLKIRDGYARALFMNESYAEALDHYSTLKKEETQPLRGFIAEMMVWFLNRATKKTGSTELPVTATKVVLSYESLDEKQRSRVTRSALTQVTWIYYLTGLWDLKGGDVNRALDKFQAAGNSPDDWLAAEAMYRAALLHMKDERYLQAKETLEYLLFSTRSAEAEVKSVYELGTCYRKLELREKAKERFEQALEKFPDSAYAERVQQQLKELEEEAEAAEVAVAEE